jgi:BioD-like phosphotransacetylase family protein
MIVAALENNTVGVVLTNNIIPSQYVISRASDLGVPLLLVPSDTYETAKMIDDMDKLLTRDDNERIDLLKKLVENNVDIDKVI